MALPDWAVVLFGMRICSPRLVAKLVSDDHVVKLARVLFNRTDLPQDGDCSHSNRSTDHDSRVEI